MDTDALIKLTKAGAKEIVAEPIEVWIPPAVQREAVEEGKAVGYPDALQIEANVTAGRVRVVHPSKLAKVLEAPLFTGGEREVIAVFRGGGFDAVVSGDQRVLNLLEGLNIPSFTPGALLVLLARQRHLKVERARSLLEALRPWISQEEDAICTMALSEVKSYEDESD